MLIHAVWRVRHHFVVLMMEFVVMIILYSMEQILINANVYVMITSQVFQMKIEHQLKGIKALNAMRISATASVVQREFALLESVAVIRIM